MNRISPETIERARRVKLLLMDCDGVLTDGRLYFDRLGESMKVFHVRDGQGLALWHRAGFRSGIITGRGAREILAARTAELGIDLLYTDSADKTKDFAEAIVAAGVTAEECAYVGDDVGDISVMKLAGLPIAVADAAPAVLPHVKHVTLTRGGFGAVREITDLLLYAHTMQPDHL